MRLAPRLVLAFGFLAALSTAGLGAALREQRVREETDRFDQEVRSACERIREDVKRQAESDRKLVSGACRSGELVDRTLLAMEAGDLDARRLALASLVPGLREAFDVDGLVLATDGGEVLGAEPRTLLGLTRSEVAAAAVTNPEHFLRGNALLRGVVSRCRRAGPNGRGVALLATRSADGLLARLGKTAGVEVTNLPDDPHAPPDPSRARASCTLADPGGTALTLTVAKSKQPLQETLEHIDQAVLLSALMATGVALIIAVLLARSLGRPIEELAAEARKVASGEARPLRVAGSGEIAELTVAFDKMIEDLEGTRRRLAATSRVAAWREVARRVAHEVKNPLAPIRAAVETLRRLRARQDPAFDDYFDEATRIVLEEVHRISNIVTEFTRFARLPPPRPQPLDLGEIARQVARLHEAHAGRIKVDVEVAGDAPQVAADRDQIVQVLTNLVQNAVDAFEGDTRGHVEIAVAPAAGGSHAAVEVKDDGPGVAAEMRPRLFEPYATSKAKGTGLGLAIAQRIAHEHEGELTYAPRGEAGARGSVFRLVLPVTGPPPVSEMPPGSLP